MASRENRHNKTPVKVTGAIFDTKMPGEATIIASKSILPQKWEVVKEFLEIKSLGEVG